MRCVKTILISTLTVGPIAMSPVRAFAQAVPTAPPATAQAAPTAAPAPADPLAAAKSPSEAVAAYTQMAAAQPNNNALELAYVHKMVELGAPELAEAQAHDLMNKNAADGQTIGVAAYMYAAKGEYGAATQQLKIALMQSPDDPFLLRTAGQMVAWYDAQTDKSKLTPTDVSALEWIRGSETGKPVYTDAYKTWNQPPAGQQNPGDQTAPLSNSTTPPTQPVKPTGDAQVIYPPSPQQTTVYVDVPQPVYVGSSPYYYSSGIWGYPYCYTNPFVVTGSWGYSNYGYYGHSGGHYTGYHSNWSGSRNYTGGSNYRGYDGDRFRGTNNQNFVPLRTDSLNADRGARYVGDRRDDIGSRTPPTFRQTSPSPTATPNRSRSSSDRPTTPSVQSMRPASPAPRDPGTVRSASPSPRSGSDSSSGSRSSGSSRSGGSSSSGGSSGGDRGARYRR